MKNLVTFALLSVAGIGLATEQAAAWCCHRCHRCSRRCEVKCCARISMSQYNAFSPWCPVSVRYRGRGCGCCPMMGCCQQPCGGQSCGNSSCCEGGCGQMGCGQMGCSDGSCGNGQLPMMNPMMGPAPAPIGADKGIPMGSAGPLPGAMGYGYPMPQGSVQPTAYNYPAAAGYQAYPGYQSGAYPAYYSANSGANMAGGPSAPGSLNAFGNTPAH